MTVYRQSGLRKTVLWGGSSGIFHGRDVAPGGRGAADCEPLNQIVCANSSRPDEASCAAIVRAEMNGGRAFVLGDFIQGGVVRRPIIGIPSAFCARRFSRCEGFDGEFAIWIFSESQIDVYTSVSS